MWLLRTFRVNRGGFADDAAGVHFAAFVTALLENFGCRVEGSSGSLQRTGSPSCERIGPGAAKRGSLSAARIQQTRSVPRTYTIASPDIDRKWYVEGEGRSSVAGKRHPGKRQPCTAPASSGGILRTVPRFAHLRALKEEDTASCLAERAEEGNRKGSRYTRGGERRGEPHRRGRATGRLRTRLAPEGGTSHSRLH